MSKIAKPKLDLVFKKVFGDVNNVDILTDFLSAVLEIPKEEILKVEILNGEIPPEALTEKFIRLDLLLKTAKGFINIEIQVNNYGDFGERALFYWSKVFSKQLGEGEEYSTLEPAISINILDFNLFKNWKNSHSTFNIVETRNHTNSSEFFKLTDKFRMDFLELPKAKKHKSESNSLQQWLDFLNVTTEEELDMINTNTTTSDTVKKAVAVIKKMSASEKEMYDIEQRENRLKNEASALANAKKQGKVELVEQMRKSGMLTEEQAKQVITNISKE